MGADFVPGMGEEKSPNSFRKKRVPLLSIIVNSYMEIVGYQVFFPIPDEMQIEVGDIVLAKPSDSVFSSLFRARCRKVYFIALRYPCKVGLDILHRRDSHYVI